MSHSVVSRLSWSPSINQSACNAKQEPVGGIMGKDCYLVSKANGFRERDKESVYDGVFSGQLHFPMRTYVNAGLQVYVCSHLRLHLHKYWRRWQGCPLAKRCFGGVFWHYATLNQIPIIIGEWTYSKVSAHVFRSHVSHWLMWGVQTLPLTL